MSYTAADMNAMGTLNQNWGVCGFTSTFYSMFALDPAKRAQLGKASIATNVLAEIKTYLRMLQAEKNTALLQEIEQFTQSFGTVPFNRSNGTTYNVDFRTWTIPTYIAAIDQTVDQAETVIKDNGFLSIGMPPAGVVDYVRRAWNYNAVGQAITGADPGTDGIVGVRKTSGGMTRYGGLCHWMYRRGGTVYSWGQTFTSISKANSEYRLCYLVTVSPR